MNFGLIDNDTPQDVYTKTSYIDGSTLELVFSDEFNVEGRSFYPGGIICFPLYNAAGVGHRLMEADFLFFFGA